jgi:xanthine dehydrogenase large subunit
VIHELVDELEASSEYRARRAAIDAFNAASPVLKKGLALTPVKFGIAFNVTHLNQAGALVHVYVDGSILVNHGGTEMGQGVNTKVMQVVAHELGVDYGPRAHHRHQYQQGRQYLGHRGLDRRGPERQGGAGRGAPDPRAPGRLRAKQYGGAAETCASRRHRLRERQEMPSASWWRRPTWRAPSCGRTATTPRPACPGMRRP